jgi:hypothetical protein
MQPGMYMQLDLEKPRWLSGATLVSHTPIYGVPMEFDAMDQAGLWHSFGAGKVEQRVWEDLRRPATRAIRRQGFSYIMVPRGKDGLGPLGEAIIGHEEEWGLEFVAEAHGYYLFRIR